MAITHRVCGDGAMTVGGQGGTGPVPEAPAKPLSLWVRFARVASNLALALLFFVGVLPAALHYGSGAADYVWAVGAALMGLLSLVRMPPKTSMVTVSSVAATAGMLLLPGMLRLSAASSGTLYMAGVVIELIAVVFMQVARLYLGRGFGLLPANRGIVAAGPFRLMRHPIYAAWLLLMGGFAMVHPSARNAIAITLALPFMVWRIAQEETLLSQDSDYRAYMQRTRFRLIPGLF
jgi:protein-S-isoprenylcysteine O-methyltransferase Ste14